MDPGIFVISGALIVPAIVLLAFRRRFPGVTPIAIGLVVGGILLFALFATLDSASF